MSSKVGILRFLGTNCDRDIWQAVEAVGLTPEWLWYDNQFDIKEYKAFVLPGGFSYGDYLRCGALAAKAPAMSSLVDAGKKGFPVLGICNGFQILCDAGLLPGALVQNENLRFVDEWSDLEITNNCSHWGGQAMKSAKLPIAHGEGRYFIEDDDLKSVQDNDQIWCTYQRNPNGSIGNIAGVMNKEKNIAGMMPHPERALFEWMGGDDGIGFFNSLKN